MALTIATEFVRACLAGGCALLDGGQFRLTASGSELANLALNATAFGTPTNANPSVATSNSITEDSGISAGTINGFALRTSGGAARISGTVGVGSGDLQVSDNVIPGDATSVSCPGGLTLTLSMS